MEEALLRGAAREAVVPAGVLCEAALKRLLGEAPEARLELGPAIGRVHSEGLLDRDWLRNLNWLKEHRNRCAHHPPRDPLPTVDDAERAAQLVARLLEDVGLVNAEQLRQVRAEARVTTCGPAPSDCMKLDRSPQRARLEDLITPPPTLLVLLTHGEVGQGHEHFSRYALLKLRSILKGRWRSATIPWPGSSLSPGNRLAQLAGALPEALKLREEPPQADPTLEEQAEPWRKFVASLHRELARRREMILLRHCIRRPCPQDAELLSRYLELAWNPLRESGYQGTVALTFEVVRAEPSGLPLLSRSWRLGQGEKKATRGLLGALGEQSVGSGSRVDALAELTSLRLDDVTSWLHTFKGMSHSEAEAEARDLLATSRGGRFEILIDQISPSTWSTP